MREFKLTRSVHQILGRRVALQELRRSAPLIILLSFLLCYRMTVPKYIGDTLRYANDVIGHVQGRETQFWEFGHLLWRPWGYVGCALLGAQYQQAFSDAPTQAVARFLIQTNFVCSAAALLFLLFLLRKAARAWVAGAVVFAMSCSLPFLDYSHSGAPYIPALMFSALALLLLTTAVEHSKGGRWCAILAGVSFAIACALWFPYSFSGLGMVATLYLWPSRDSDAMNTQGPVRHQLMASFLLALVASACFLFAAGAAAKGIRSLNQLSQWALESDNGWSQSNTAMRAITGLPRSIWDLGNDTILLKRWLFSDPYNPVHISTLVFSLGGKLAAFYLALGAALWALWKDQRAMLFMLTAAGLPVLLFAIVIFEPSSSERFLPVFPFAFLVFAVVLDRSRRHVVASAFIAILLVGSTVLNLAEHGRMSAGAGRTETRKRIQALNSNVQPGALVWVVTIRDDLYSLPATNPLDKKMASSRFRVTDAVEVASRRIKRWRTVFAEQTQEQWAQHREVWFSERLLAQRPEAHWLWVEGDDRRIRWSDLPVAFGQLETDLKVQMGGDGFLRLAESQANRNRLAKWAKEETGPNTEQRQRSPIKQVPDESTE